MWLNLKQHCYLLFQMINLAHQVMQGAILMDFIQCCWLSRIDLWIISWFSLAPGNDTKTYPIKASWVFYMCRRPGALPPWPPPGVLKRAPGPPAVTGECSARYTLHIFPVFFKVPVSGQNYKVCIENLTSSLIRVSELHYSLWLFEPCI